MVIEEQLAVSAIGSNMAKLTFFNEKNQDLNYFSRTKVILHSHSSEFGSLFSYQHFLPR